MRFLITGTAGFIGFHLARRLLGDGHIVIGIDGMTPYYDVALKRARHALLAQTNAFTAHEFMIEDASALNLAFEDAKPDIVIHLAAQAGVRYSIENPRAYLDANLVGAFNVLEAVRVCAPKHFLFASTSSVYGANAQTPFRETDRADHPMTLYAASKKAGEGMAHSYAHLWKIPTTCFRFFTVYGPWGRPDMALFKFVRATLAGEPIDVYGHGAMMRDFTYIDDLVEAVTRLVDCTPAPNKPVGECDSLSPAAPWRIVNIGGGRPTGLLDFIDEVERVLGVPVQRRMIDMQPGDVAQTFASAALLQALTGFCPATPLAVGVRAFVDWHKAHYCT